MIAHTMRTRTVAHSLPPGIMRKHADMRLSLIFFKNFSIIIFLAYNFTNDKAYNIINDMTYNITNERANQGAYFTDEFNNLFFY